jgi:hypothetical protein
LIAIPLMCLVGIVVAIFSGFRLDWAGMRC